MTDEDQALARIYHSRTDRRTYISGLGQKELRQNGVETQKPKEAFCNFEALNGKNKVTDNGKK